MPNLSLGTIEVLGLPAAVEAADVALKTADVHLIGYETTDGMGMVAVKIEGQVSAVQSAVAAARAAAERITKVFAVSVIARPSVQLAPVVLTELTVGLDRPAPAESDEPADSNEGAESSEPAEEPETASEPVAPVIETQPMQEASEPAAAQPVEAPASPAPKPRVRSVKPAAKS